jgi:hypothetical protein
MITNFTIEAVSWECVHFCEAPEFEKMASGLKLSPVSFISCSVACINDDSALLRVVGSTLRFPDYFGENWDALDECLCDMEWFPANGYALFLTESRGLWSTAPYSGGKLISSWQAAASVWSEQKIPFHLVFVL